MKKPFLQTALGRTILGKNKAGQVVHGIVDILPFPNLFNPLRAAYAENPDRKLTETISRAYTKVDLIRLLTALGLSYLIVSGKLSLEEAQAILESVTNFSV